PEKKLYESEGKYYMKAFGNPIDEYSFTPGGVMLQYQGDSPDGYGVFVPVEDSKLKPALYDHGVKIKKANTFQITSSKGFSALDDLLTKWPDKEKSNNIVTAAYKFESGIFSISSKTPAYLLFCESVKYPRSYAVVHCEYGFVSVEYCRNIGEKRLFFKLTTSGLFWNENGNTKINLSAIYQILLRTFFELHWTESVFWRPNYVLSENLPGNVKVLKAEEVAGCPDKADAIVKEIESVYDNVINQVNELKQKIEAAKLDIITQEAANKEVEEVEVDPNKSLVDADQVNREKLVDRAKEFSSRGMTLDLKESNFDGKYPIMAAPIFPDPTSFYLRELSEKFILPSVEELKLNSISCFQTNPAFEEAFLAGMNTEMGRELLWREYPTDERGSYFRKFWDQEVLPDDFGNGYFDVKYMHNWKGRLGENHEPGKGKMIVFVVKSELMMMYPQTSICLAEAKTQGGDIYLSKILSPAMTGWLSDDTFMAGFYPGELKTTKGVYLAFVETDKSQRFSQTMKQNAVNNKYPDNLSSEFAYNRVDHGSVWGAEIHPDYLQL
ncbi:MAG: hypothetical protein IJL91_10025, partial [Bacteroidales bacterium]|nr:hypothetical protein [Bacteroidales bacterium]